MNVDENIDEGYSEDTGEDNLEDLNDDIRETDEDSLEDSDEDTFETDFLNIICYNITDHNNKILKLSWNPYKQILITCSSDKALLHYVIDNRRILFDATIVAVDWNPNGSMLAIANYHERTVQLHDISRNGSLIRGLTGHDNILHIQFNLDGSLIGACGYGGQVTIWNVNNGEIVWNHTLLLLNRYLSILDWNSTFTFAAGCSDGNIYYYNISRSPFAPPGAFIGHEPNNTIEDIKWNSQTNILASRSTDRTIKLWVLSQSNCIKSFRLFAEYPVSIEWLFTGNDLMISVDNLHIYYYNVEYGVFTKKLIQNTQQLSVFSLSSSEKLLATGTTELFIYSLKSHPCNWKKIWECPEEINIIKWNSNDDKLAVSTNSNYVVLIFET